MHKLIDIPELPPGFADCEDFRRAARRRLPHFVFEYLDGGVGRDANMARNASMLDRVIITPRMNDDPRDADPSVELMGERWAFPFGVAPLGGSSAFHHASAPVLAKRAAKLGVPFCLSLVAGHSTEGVAAAAGRPPWQQLYWPDLKDVQADILARMRALGVEVLVPTIDIPTWQWRERSVRARAGGDLSLGRKLHTALTRPRWTLDVLRHGAPGAPNLAPYAPGGMAAAEAFLFRHALRPVGLEDLKALRDDWDGKIVVKGVMAPEDAEALAAIGMDGVVVSNHGGRQLDAAPSTVEMLPPIAEAVKGRIAILADGGVASGLDILRLIRLGADFVLVGRMPYYAMAGLGEAGAASLDLLAIQTQTLMYQLGVRSLEELMGLRVAVDRP